MQRQAGYYAVKYHGIDRIAKTNGKGDWVILQCPAYETVQDAFDFISEWPIHSGEQYINKVTTEQSTEALNRAIDILGIDKCNEMLREIKSKNPIKEEQQDPLSASLMSAQEWLEKYHDAGVGTYRIADVMQGYTDYVIQLQAVASPIEELTTIGVGEGGGDMYVKGSYASIKHLQNKLLELERLRIKESERDNDYVGFLTPEQWIERKGNVAKFEMSRKDLMAAYADYLIDWRTIKTGSFVNSFGFQSGILDREEGEMEVVCDKIKMADSSLQAIKILERFISERTTNTTGIPSAEDISCRIKEEYKKYKNSENIDWSLMAACKIHAVLKQLTNAVSNNEIEEKAEAEYPYSPNEDWKPTTMTIKDLVMKLNEAYILGYKKSMKDRAGFTEADIMDFTKWWRTSEYGYSPELDNWIDSIGKILNTSEIFIEYLKQNNG